PIPAKVKPVAHLVNRYSPVKELNTRKSPVALSCKQTSKSVTLKLQEAVRPPESVAVQLTVVVPSGKTDPDGGEQTTVAPGQLSITVGAGYVTIALGSPGFGATAIRSFGQVMTGAGLDAVVVVMAVLLAELLSGGVAALALAVLLMIVPSGTLQLIVTITVKVASSPTATLPF